MTQRQGEGVTGALPGALSLVYCSETAGGHAKGHKKRYKQVPPLRVCFTRQELTILLNLYGRNVSSGHWHDYAMDFLKDRALFSIFRRNSQQADFVIEKNPKFACKQGQYLVAGQQGRVLRRGANLSQVLRVLDPALMVIK